MKNFFIKKIINGANINLDKYKIKECLNTGIGKLGDTQKMKNKMSTLPEDYLYSDKIHDGLITNPANKILDAMINYNKLKLILKMNKKTKDKE